MATFHFEAMNAQGEEIVDSIEAGDATQAQAELSRRGLFVTKLAQIAPSPTRRANGEAPKAREKRPGRRSPSPEIQARHARERRALGVGFVIIGSAVFLFGVWLAIDAVPFVLSAERAKGMCIGQAYNSSDNEYNIPKIEFTVDGTTHRVESKGILGMQFVSGYRKGIRMTMLYPPGHPEDARVGGVISNLQFPLAFLFGGVLFAGSGAWLMRFRPA